MGGPFTNTGGAEVAAAEEATATAMIAHKLARLSVDARERVFHDLHGISEIQEETPEFLDDKLNMLDAELKQIPTKAAYDHAFEREPTKLRDRNFRLKFLRATSFDEKAAAKRLIIHLDQKRALFGDDKILKNITLSDLGEEEREILDLGWNTVLPLRDRSRRVLLAHHPYRLAHKDYSSEARLRVMMYLILSLADDVENQQRGMVKVVLNMEPKPINHIELSKSNVLVSTCLPIKCVAVHMFEENTQGSTDLVPAVVNHMLDENVQVRFRKVLVPANDFQQIHFVLNTFGIPVQVLPVKENGEFDSTYHKMYLDARKSSEEAATRPTTCNLDNSGEHEIDKESSPTATETSILTPGFNDVIYGSDSLSRTHVGNVKYHAKIRELFPEYDATTDRLKRGDFFQQVLHTIHSSGGRFLRRDEHGSSWVHVSDDVALKKISNSFRTLRRNEKLKSRRGTTTQTTPPRLLNMNIS